MSVGVFETIRVRNGRAPLLERHTERLTAACGALHLALPGETLAQLVAPWLSAGDRIVRVEITGAGATVTHRTVGPCTPFAVAVAATWHIPYPFKVSERAAFDAAMAEARAGGADDALLVTQGGAVVEGTTWNVFWWECDRLATPPLALGALPGVARARVAELVLVLERERAPADLVGSSLFATNAVRGIVPICRLGDATLPDDPRTERLAQRFWPV